MIKLDNKIRDIHPESLLPKKKCKVIEFDNKHDLLVFLEKHEAIKDSIDHTKDFYSALHSYKPNEELVKKIKHDVLNNLLKRGIITGSIYEGFKYEKEGEIIDYAKLASGDPMCMMVPIKKYDKYFYELYINMSIPGRIPEEEIEKGAIRLVETIKALEELDIEIKINVIDYSERLYYDEDINDLLVIIPLLSHLEHKEYSLLMPFIIGAFLRGPLFTIARNSIDNIEHINNSMGYAYCLENAINLWQLKEDSEVALVNRILNDLGIVL